MSDDQFDSKVEIELLKKDVNIMASLLTKFDSTLEKLQEIASNLTRMESLQEQRIETQGKSYKEVQSILETRRIEHNADIKELHNRITTTNQELSVKIEETEKVILRELREMREEMKDLKKKPTDEDSSVGKRLSKIESWQYMVIGGLMVVTWIAAKIDLVKILFSR